MLPRMVASLCVAEVWKGPLSLQHYLLEVGAEGGRGAVLFLHVNLS